MKHRIGGGKKLDYGSALVIGSSISENGARQSGAAANAAANPDGAHLVSSPLPTSSLPSSPELFVHGAWSRRNARLVLATFFFWTLVLTLMVIHHMAVTTTTITMNGAAAPGSHIRHGLQRFVLEARSNLLLTTALGSVGVFDRLVSYRLCCVMPGGQMECPDARELECHVLRDEGPRLTCYWVAPRLVGAHCVIYWAEASA